MISRQIKTAMLVAGLALSSAVFAAPIQTLTFGGTLAYGSNYNASSPFGPANSDLGNKAYSVTLSYDPSLFSSAASNSCFPTTSASCQIQISVARPVTETITVNGLSQVFTATSGSFSFTGANSDSFNFNLNGAGGLSISGSFQDTTLFFPNQNDLRAPIFSNFTNLAVSGNFNQSANNYSFGANPNRLSAAYSTGVTAQAVPEPVSLALLAAGLVGGGLARRRRKA